MSFSKKVNRIYIAHAVEKIRLQVKRFITLCSAAKGIQIVSEIIDKIQLLKERFSQEEQQYIGKQISEQEKEKIEEEDIFIEQPIAVKELTPRMYDEEKNTELTKLRRKKQKLKKRIELDLRKSVQLKQQEAQAVQDVRREQSQRRYKKELFVVEKQTEQARKMHKKMEKVKMIRKSIHSPGDKKTKGKDNSLKSKLDKLSRRKKK